MIRKRMFEALLDFGQRRTAIGAKLAALAEIYLNAYHNCDYVFETNGELELMRRLAPFKPQVIFDVGANRGDWASCAAKELPTAEIHCFEIVPTTFNLLKTRLGNTDRITVNPFGLGQEETNCQITFYGEDDTLSTLVAPPIHGERLAGESVACVVQTGDAYCRDNKIATIDFLKIDTEGAEHLVLQGFKSGLEGRNINVIQFEYGLANIYSKFLLKDYFEWFASLGYQLGKLFPDGVEFGRYRARDEDFRGPNYVAVRSDRADLLRALKTSSAEIK